MTATSTAPDDDALADERLVELAKAGEARAFRLLMTRHNRRVYRTARGILADDAEAEDAAQDAWLAAFRNLAGFRGEARFSTWLTRIVLNEALGRKRRRRPTVELKELDMAEAPGETRIIPFPAPREGADPERDAGRRELRRLLERAVDELPEAFRIVFVLREMEQLSVEETAHQLDLRPETVKTRLHRARRLLRAALADRLGAVLPETYAFAGARCERITARVLRALGVPPA